MKVIQTALLAVIAIVGVMALGEFQGFQSRNDPNYGLSPASIEVNEAIDRILGPNAKF